VLDHLPEPKTASDRTVLLDLGCGYGLFLALAKIANPKLHVIGLDLSEIKISAARRAFDASKYPVQLAVIDISDFPEQSVDVITIIDVLYLVPIDQWNGILRKCFECLKPGGRLLLKEMNRSITWKFVLLYFEETIAVKILGWTLGQSFTFPEPEETRRYLEQAGFAVEEIPLHRGHFAPHHLWIGHRKP